MDRSLHPMRHVRRPMVAKDRRTAKCIAPLAGVSSTGLELLMTAKEYALSMAAIFLCVWLAFPVGWLALMGWIIYRVGTGDPR